MAALGSALVFAAACVVGVSGCGSGADSVDYRQDALAALEEAAAWEVTTIGLDGHTITEWWSAGSPLYRWDDSFDGQIQASTATDGKVLFTPGPDGAYYAQDLGTDSEYHPNPTAFTSYYWYLKQGRPIETTTSPSEPDVLTIVLKDAPSELTARLRADTLLPFEFVGRSEMTGQRGIAAVTLKPIDLSAVGSAVGELESKPAPEYPDVTVEDHLVTSLRAVGIDCFSAKSRTDQAGHMDVLDLMVQVSPEERSADKDEALALSVLPLVREYKSALGIGRVYIQILSIDKAPIYEAGFDLE